MNNKVCYSINSAGSLLLLQLGKGSNLSLNSANGLFVLHNEVGVGLGVEGFFGGDDAGVLKIGAEVIFSRKKSNCFSDKALCRVSSGRIGGTPPNPSSTAK